MRQRRTVNGRGGCERVGRLALTEIKRANYHRDGWFEISPFFSSRNFKHIGDLAGTECHIWVKYAGVEGCWLFWENPNWNQIRETDSRIRPWFPVWEIPKGDASFPHLWGYEHNHGMVEGGKLQSGVFFQFKNCLYERRRRLFLCWEDSCCVAKAWHYLVVVTSQTHKQVQVTG